VKRLRRNRWLLRACWVALTTNLLTGFLIAYFAGSLRESIKRLKREIAERVPLAEEALIHATAIAQAARDEYDDDDDDGAVKVG
jgi:hypothetical protein